MLPLIAASPTIMGYIPSPKHGELHLGPLRLHAYGLMLALGILAAVLIAERRWAARGHDPREIAQITFPVVVAGILGARIYHLFTGYDWNRDGLAGSLQIWRGGLSIWGAVAGGLLAAAYMAHRKHLDTLDLFDAVGPAVVVAQAIGRWGNWFNQELFGRPTTLPWGLRIDVAHRPVGYTQFETFHPTFLYESVWCLLVFGIIVWAERRRALCKGQAFALYVALYTFGRIWFEALRVDKATHVFGIRFNLLMSVVLCVGATIWFVWLGRRDRGASGASPIGEPAATP
jgi:prolipoprotein diacylglyceryl transferase